MYIGTHACMELIVGRIFIGLEIDGGQSPYKARLNTTIDYVFYFSFFI